MNVLDGFNERFEELIKDEGVSGYRISSDLNLSMPRVYNILKNKKMHIEAFIKICEFYNFSANYIIFGIGPKKIDNNIGVFERTIPSKDVKDKIDNIISELKDLSNSLGRE